MLERSLMVRAQTKTLLHTKFFLVPCSFVKVLSDPCQSVQEQRVGIIDEDEETGGQNLLTRRYPKSSESTSKRHLLPLVWKVPASQAKEGERRPPRWTLHHIEGGEAPHFTSRYTTRQQQN
ncbi:hypothetical protein PPYR_14040 [Photinus pyralis]|uniref:Uncharacterized protein n=1 Tax=Photinus pyralis TaxID=7054 RepID=A0A5N4A483_PHOPY|nr:hypothetical protein PPYR_14040 [Photinus pyralis]